LRARHYWRWIGGEVVAISTFRIEGQAALWANQVASSADDDAVEIERIAGGKRVDVAVVREVSTRPKLS